MTTLPNLSSSSSSSSSDGSLRLELYERATAGGPDGAWWPRSRSLQVEARALVDQFPAGVGRINRLLFSRPDWDDGMVGTRGLRRIAATRGPVKVGSFPADDTHLMVLSMANGRRLRLRVVPCDTPADEADRILAGN